MVAFLASPVLNVYTKFFSHTILYHILNNTGLQFFKPLILYPGVQRERMPRRVGIVGFGQLGESVSVLYVQYDSVM